MEEDTEKGSTAPHPETQPEEDKVEKTPAFTEQPKRKVSVVVPLLTIVTLLALGAAGYLVYRYYLAYRFTTAPPRLETAIENPDLPKDWKIYTTSHYSVKYPPDWNYHQYHDNFDTVRFSNSQDIINNDPGTHPELDISWYNGTMPPDERIRELSGFYELNGYIGYTQENPQAGGNPGTSIQLKHPDYGYVRINYRWGDKKQFDQILSTFEFSGRQNKDYINGITWREYGNNEYSFKLPYPDTWTVVENPKESRAIVKFQSDISSGIPYGPLSPPADFDYSITVYYINNPTGLKIDKLVSGLNADVPITTKEVTLNGIRFYVSSSVPSMSGNLDYYTQTASGSYIGLSLSPYDSNGQDENRKKILDIFNRILSSFQLIVKED